MHYGNLDVHEQGDDLVFQLQVYLGDIPPDYVQDAFFLKLVDRSAVPYVWFQGKVPFIRPILYFLQVDGEERNPAIKGLRDCYVGVRSSPPTYIVSLLHPGYAC